MPRSYDPHLAAYPLYQEGYDHGFADADRGHKLDYPLGILLGGGVALAIACGVPQLIRLIFP